MERLFSFALVILTFLNSSFAQDVCVKKGPCTCEFANGTGIDLTVVANAAADAMVAPPTYVQKDKPVQLVLQKYYFHPCVDVLVKNATTGTNNTCNVPLSVYRQVYTMDLVNGTTDTFKEDAGMCNFLGNVNATKFSSDGSTIVYSNAGSTTTVNLVCAQTEDKLHVVTADEENNIQLAFYSREACLRQIQELGRSFGSTLCIIFFSLVIFYLSLGVLTRKFLMGATGLEVIPNLPFWLGLPDLVKDGWAFARNGFKLPARGSGPTISPDPNSYDSI